MKQTADMDVEPARKKVIRTLARFQQHEQNKAKDSSEQSHERGESDSGHGSNVSPVVKMLDF